jgi:hypothetical protein
VRPPLPSLCALALAVPIALVACGDDDEGASPADAPGSSSPASSVHRASPDTALVAGDDVQRYPDVVAAEATRDGDGWTFAVTISSPYDSPDRYADAWRVVGPDGTVYGERILTHHHAGEQPFTRSQSGIVIPAGVDTVLIEARDQRYGWGGGTVGVDLPPDDG